MEYPRLDRNQTSGGGGGAPTVMIRGRSSTMTEGRFGPLRISCDVLAEDRARARSDGASFAGSYGFSNGPDTCGIRGDRLQIAVDLRPARNYVEGVRQREGAV